MHKNKVLEIIDETMYPFWRELQAIRRRVLLLEQKLDEERCTRLRNVLKEVEEDE